MIAGSVNFNGSVSKIVSSSIRAEYPNLFFHRVNHKGFEGGYYLHPRLPYIPDDLYYYNEATDIVVLLSGTVYNKAELMRADDSRVRVKDPELIASLFLRDGPGFVRKLNGDFAVFIMQPARKEAYLFRDHLGVRPLAWVAEGQRLHFANDIMGFCRTYSDGQTIDSEYLLGYFKYIDYRRTPNNRIKKLPPGQYLHFSESAIGIKKYWEPEKIRIDRKLPYDRMLSELKDIVSDAVRMRCDSRFTAGAHVSSGIDSGFVSILAGKECSHQKYFYGFSWSPADYTTHDVKHDEREIIKSSCVKSKISPVFSDLNESEFTSLVSDHYHNQGYVSEDKTVEQAVEAGINLIFTGWGGDEFISTGHSGVDLDLLRRLRFRAFFRRNPVKEPKKFIRHLLFFVVYPALHILDPRSARSFSNDVRYIRKPFKKSSRGAIANFYFHASRHQMHLNALQFYNLQERCESWHMLGFRKGVEYRFPLLDKRIIEYMLKVPSELLCETDYFRPLLREIGKGILPEEVRLNQSKNDPVYREFIDKLHKASALSFMEEADAWRANPDMHFIDFDLLLEDIAKYKSQSPGVGSKAFFRTLVYAKAIHEFSRKYQELNEF
jgi:asparagine synthase (glutamine-hydrolysing)